MEMQANDTRSVAGLVPLRHFEVRLKHESRRTTATTESNSDRPAESASRQARFAGAFEFAVRGAINVDCDDQSFWPQSVAADASP